MRQWHLTDIYSAVTSYAAATSAQAAGDVGPATAAAAQARDALKVALASAEEAINGNIHPEDLAGLQRLQLLLPTQELAAIEILRDVLKRNTPAASFRAIGALPLVSLLDPSRRATRGENVAAAATAAAATAAAANAENDARRSRTLWAMCSVCKKRLPVRVSEKTMLMFGHVTDSGGRCKGPMEAGARRPLRDGELCDIV